MAEKTRSGKRILSAHEPDFRKSKPMAQRSRKLRPRQTDRGRGEGTRAGAESDRQTRLEREPAWPLADCRQSYAGGLAQSSFLSGWRRVSFARRHRAEIWAEYRERDARQRFERDH